MFVSQLDFETKGCVWENEYSAGETWFIVRLLIGLQGSLRGSMNSLVHSANVSASHDLWFFSAEP